MAKPAFDPNKPFKAVQSAAGEKPAFDPNKPFNVVSQAEPKQNMTFMGQLNEGIKQAPEALGSAAGLALGGPIGAGIGAGIGKAASEAASGVESIIKDPKKFVEDLGRLPTKEQVVEQVAKYLTTIGLNTVVPAVVEKVAGVVQAAPKEIAKEAEKKAVTATGATGLQASKFEEGAGRELLDRKLVGFGDTPAKIAQKTQAAVDKANSQIDNALSILDEKGVKVDVKNIIAKITQKIDALRKDPAQADVVKKLEGIVENIQNTGEEFISASQGEQTKRGFNKIAGNWLDPEKGQAGKIAYQAYKNEVEQTAQKYMPELAKSFKEGKETFGLLAPIKEAAERRASTLNQSPIGGLLDVAAAGGAGGMVGGVPGIATGVAAAAARRIISPRIASSAAVTLDKVSKALSGVPQYAKLMKDNPQAFQALADSVYQSYQKPELSKFAKNGITNLKSVGIDQEVIDTLSPQQLEEASSYKKGSPQMNKFLEKLKAKNPDVSMTFPMTVRKNGYSAQVSNKTELEEAKSEGWA